MTSAQIYILQEALTLLKHIQVADLMVEAQEIYHEGGNMQAYVECFRSHETIANFENLIQELSKGGAE